MTRAISSDVELRYLNERRGVTYGSVLKWYCGVCYIRLPWQVPTLNNADVCFLYYILLQCSLKCCSVWIAAFNWWKEYLRGIENKCKYVAFIAICVWGLPSPCPASSAIFETLCKNVYASSNSSADAENPSNSVNI